MCVILVHINLPIGFLLEDVGRKGKRIQNAQDGPRWVSPLSQGSSVHIDKGS